MLHPLTEARVEEAIELLANMTKDEAIDLDCLKEWQEAFDFMRDYNNGAYANGSW